MDQMYQATPDGYCGDEDNGQTSAWYVFSALGFYPVCPGTDEYVLGAPLFKKATLTFANGNRMTINAPDNSERNVYIKSLMLNGVPYTKNFVRHNDLQKGGVMDYRMSETPERTRGIGKDDMPYSFSNR